MENEHSQIKNSIFRRWWFWVGGTIFIICLIGAGWKVSHQKKNVPKESETNTSEMISKESGYWVQDRDSWKPVGDPPDCPSSLMFSIADLSSATSVLYPGQMRSAGYEPTAGFRYDTATDNSITVKAPLDGEIIQAVRYSEQGHIQYALDILSPCGIMNRFDHILELPKNLQLLADTLPPPKENDTRSSSVIPPIQVKKGEVIAEAVGNANNVYISWTVFDLRNKNESSQNEAWAQEQPVLYHYAICPFGFMSTTPLQKF